MLKTFTPVPLQLAPTFDLSAWYDASVPSSIVESPAGRVSVWRDLSGEKNNATIPGGLNAPQTGVDTLAGKNVITFSTALSTGMLLPGNITPNLSTGSFTFFSVAFSTDSTASSQGFIIGTTLTNRFYVQILETTAQLRGFYGPNPLFSLTLSDTANVAPFVVMSSSNGTTDECKLTYNRTSTVSGTKAIDPSLANIVLGASFGAHLDGYIAEVICFRSVLDDASMDSVWYYLGNKWGISL